VAYPILRRYGYPATVFLVSDYLEGANCWDQQSELTGRPLLLWSNVCEMHENGIQIGAHTRTHPALTGISSEQARAEIEGSREALEQKLGVPVSVFSYPYGDHNTAVQVIAEQAGFLGSCSVLSGLNTPMTPLHALRRIEIWGHDSLVQFALAVRFGERAQTVWKWIWRW
jgi:peptidoglycan/xylan/chitin deacetylase (PgdA/CDA1 family)